MISVIIPMYNSEGTIGALIKSLFAGTCKDFEIIVVDDGSSDRSKDVVSAFKATLESTGGRRGPAVARNIGARKAKGDVLLFLDSDTLTRSDLLTHIANRFDSEAELVAIVGYYDKRPLNSGFFPRYKALLVNHWFRDAKIMESFETCCGAIRKAAFEQAGGFDEFYTNADVEDYEFGHRVMEQGEIQVDHKMIVGHHFPSFAKNFVNYYRRSRLWMELFIARHRFESTATTSAEGITRILPVIALVLLSVGWWWTPLFCAGFIAAMIYLFLVRDFLRLLHNEEGAIFAGLGTAVHAVNSFAVVMGALVSLLNYVFRRGKGEDVSH